MKKASRAILLLLLAAASALALTGCYNYDEIENLMIVSGTAIDYDSENDLFTVTAEIIDLSESKTDTKYKTHTIEAESKTIAGAISSMGRVAGKQLYWGHASVVVLSRDCASAELERTLRWLAVDKNSRLSAMLLIADTEKASDLLKIKGLSDESAAFSLNKMLTNHDRGPQNIAKVYEVIDRIGEGEGMIVLPLVGEEENEGEKILTIIGSAVISGTKYLGDYDIRQTGFLTLLTMKKADGVYRVEAQNAVYYMKVASFDYTVDISVKENHAEVKLQLDAALELADSECEQDLLDAEVNAEAEAAAAQALVDGCAEIIGEDLDRFDADVLHIGRDLMRRQPEAWRGLIGENGSWSGIYRNTVFTISASARIVTSGKSDGLMFDDSEED